MTCPCGGDSYATCCGQFLAGMRQPDTAEQLMRSRYTAYAQDDVNYLYETSHPMVQAVFDRQAVADWSASSQWLDLTVEAVVGGSAPEQTGTVTFRARYRQNGEIYVHHEHSTFQRVAGRWTYRQGEPPPMMKVGRNDPCPCGSERKYKKCCGHGGS